MLVALRGSVVSALGLLTFLIAGAAPVCAEPPSPPPDRARLEAALARLEAQIPLTAADHTALKKAALAKTLSGMRVCGDPGNLPLSDINRAGYQNKIIEMLAAEMGTTVTYFWRPYLERGITRQTFETGDCDVLLDLPVGFERVLTTEPIYRTTYVLAYRNDKGIDIKSLDDPKLKELKIGTFQTSGLRTALAKRGIRNNVSLHVLSHNADLNPENQPWIQVDKVIKGELDVAGVWGPFAGWQQKMKGAPIVVQPVNMWEDEIPLEFDLAIALRKIDWVLKYKFDLALEAKKTEIAKILQDYGVPLVQCSKCYVPGDLPSHGIYTKPVEASDGAGSGPIAADQKVTKDRLKAWLADGADINQELSNAVLGGDVARIAFLIEKGADVNKLDAQGYTALHSAARHRRAELISALLAYKADPNVLDSDGFSALHHAVLRDHPASVKALASRGANVEALTKTGFTPLALAIIEDKYKAAMALIEAGANVEVAVGDAKLTPLMLTAGKEARVLSLGAGTTRVEKLNPLDPGQVEVAKALIDKGAKVNAIAGSGVTALLLAAAHNNAPIVGLLAEAGADASIKTPGGETAVDLAKRNGNAAVVSLLGLLTQAGSN
ncbi:MAG: quinoprotein dehydrogenase-associated putative ABC transporter substrate-binding protein [Hyphomicrobium sp.]|nr:quinoprotein dehydrogenase-associated putative ABC transporter substrate-binding protein [Hyphomicrobium sp.]